MMRLRRRWPIEYGQAPVGAPSHVAGFTGQLGRCRPVSVAAGGSFGRGHDKAVTSPRRRQIDPCGTPEFRPRASVAPHWPRRRRGAAAMARTTRMPVSVPDCPRRGWQGPCISRHGRSRSSGDARCGGAARRCRATAAGVHRLTDRDSPRPRAHHDPLRWTRPRRPRRRSGAISDRTSLNRSAANGRGSMAGVSPAISAATISAVAGAPVRPTWPWPNAKYALRARRRSPDDRLRVRQRRAVAHPALDAPVRKPREQPLRAFEQHVRAIVVRRCRETRELDRTGDAQAAFHRRREILALARGGRNARLDRRRREHHVVAALGLERDLGTELRRERVRMRTRRDHDRVRLDRPLRRSRRAALARLRARSPSPRVRRTLLPPLAAVRQAPATGAADSGRGPARAAPPGG